MIDPKKTFIAQQMLGYDVEKLNKQLDAEGNSLAKKFVSSPIILYGSIVKDKKALLSAIVLLLEASFDTPVSTIKPRV